MGIDRGSAILFALAIVAGVGVVWCALLAVRAREVRVRALWIGRAVGLVGAVWALGFPAMLYGEIVTLAERGEVPTYDIQRAMWFEFGALPFTVVPAVLALRWVRTGAALFVVQGVLSMYLMVVQPFGVLFPEATSSGFIGIPVLDLVLQPAFVAALFLLYGASRRDHHGTTLAAAAR